MTLNDLSNILWVRFSDYGPGAIMIGVSIIVYALASNVAWLSRHPLSGRIERFVTWANTSWISRVLGEIIRWAYYLVVPWAALMLGYITIRALGIWRMNWLVPMGDFGLLALGAAAAFVWIWRPYTRAEHLNSFDMSGWNLARHIIEIIYQEAHWAFYRSGPFLWIGNSYWAGFFGLALVLVEGWTNPAVRHHVQDTARADSPLWTASLAIVSAIIFVFTQNTWYCLATHLLLDVGLRSLIGFPRPHPTGHIPPDA